MTIDIQTAVANVLVGRTADGASELQRSLSFTADRTVRTAFVEIVAQIVASLKEAGTDLSGTEFTALIFKLAAHASKSGWQSPQSMQNLAALAPTLSDAISEKRAALCAPMNIDGMLRAHATRASQRSARTADLALADDTPTAIAYAADDSYSLVELTTPAHLMAESAALGHCVGTLFVGSILWAKNLSEDDPEAAQYLSYAIKIRSKELRIFSLRSAGKPCATIAYNVRWRRIDQIEGRHRRFLGTEPFLPALCELLHVLASMIDIARIRGLPLPPDGMVLTRHNRYVRFDEAAAEDILSGSIIDTGNITTERFHALCACRRITLRVSQSDLLRLPGRVLANLTTDAPEFNVPQLEHASSIYACSARCFVVPGLQTAGTIEVHKAEMIDAPRVHACDYIDAQGATSLTLPHLQSADSIVTNNVPFVFLPALAATMGHISASGAETFAAPMLQRAGDICLDSLTHLDLPRLKSARDISIRSARSFHLPALEILRDIWAGQVAKFHTPRLRRAAHVHAGNASQFIAPHLCDVEILHAKSAEIFDAPHVPTDAHVMRRSAEAPVTARGRQRDGVNI